MYPQFGLRSFPLTPSLCVSYSVPPIHSRFFYTVNSNMLAKLAYMQVSGDEAVTAAEGKR